LPGTLMPNERNKIFNRKESIRDTIH
jgi:hypothetical protein